MPFTFDQICRSGGADLVYVLHVGGMDWAATNDNRLITALKLDDVSPGGSPSTVDANTIEMREWLFGLNYKDSDNFTPSNEVHILQNLDDNLGSQTVDYDEEKGLRVGSWTTAVFGGKHGYVWRWSTDIVCWGVMGLDVAPILSTPGVSSGVISRDFNTNPSAGDPWQSTLYWWQDTDEGLKAYIDAKIAAEAHCYLWVGNSCLLVIDSSVGTEGEEYKVLCVNQVFNTPNELIFRDNLQGLETLRITNVPKTLKDATSKLFAIHWDSDMQAQYEANL